MTVKRKGRYVEVGAITLGDVYADEVGEWDTDLDQAVLDGINETRDPMTKRIKIFVLLEE